MSVLEAVTRATIPIVGQHERRNLRFVFAIVAFVLAAVLIGLGIAQRTVLASPDTVTATAELTEDAPLAVIDGESLTAHDGRQTVSIDGEGTVFAAYGRTADVDAWIGDATVNRISVDTETEDGTSDFVIDHQTGTETQVPNPLGSDLWLADFQADNTLTFTVNVPSDVSIIIASDGVAPAPADISVTWPVDNSAPLSGPLIVGGSLLLLAGLGLLLWAIIHLRRSRGPRRSQPKQPKSPKMPKPPRQRAFKQSATAQTPTNARGRRSRRPMIAVVPVIAGALVLSGCSADSWPEFLGGSGAEPTPTATAEAPAEELPATAVTVAQAKNIVAQVGTVTSEADASANADLAATRLDGPALELRKANYAARAADGAIAALSAIPGEPVTLTLPQQTGDAWPRTVLTVVQPPAPEPPTDPAATPEPAPAPVALVLVQPDPRSQYKVHYAIPLLTEAELPVAPASVGAAPLPEDSKLLSLTPAEVGPAYADVLQNGEASASFPLFDTANDKLLAQLGKAYKDERVAALQTASLTFAQAPGGGQTVALATNDTGALVAVNLNEIETITPTEAGAAVNAEGQVKALSGVSQSTKGLTATYGMQLLFYVPPVSESDQKIVLLGYAQGLIGASEVP